MKRSLVCALALSLALAGLSATPFPAAAGESSDLEQRLARAELLAGLTPVQGPGVIIKLRNSPRAAPKGVDRKALQVQVQDFNAILNTLRAAGAEALAIGGEGRAEMERVLVSTAVVEGYNGLVVNGVTLRQPFRIAAIGDARRFRTELLREGGAVKKSGLDVLQMIEIEDGANLALPAARGTAELRYARAIMGEAPEAMGDSGSSAGDDDSNPTPIPPRAETEPKVITGITRRTPPGVRPPMNRTEPQGKQEPVQPEVKSEPAKPAEKPEKPKAKPVDKPVAKPAEKPAAKRPGGAVFGGRGLAKFHHPGCRYGERIEAAQRIVFASVEEAMQKGRTPCPICHIN